MADEERRRLERTVLTDPADAEARERLEQMRCKASECCAHSHDYPRPSIPGPPDAAHEALVVVEECEFTETNPVQLIRDRGVLTEIIGGQQEVEVNMSIRIVGPAQSAIAAMHWLRQVFDMQDRSTGVMDTRNLGERLWRPREGPFKDSVDWRWVDDRWVMFFTTTDSALVESATEPDANEDVHAWMSEPLETAAVAPCDLVACDVTVPHGHPICPVCFEPDVTCRCDPAEESPL